MPVIGDRSALSAVKWRLDRGDVLRLLQLCRRVGDHYLELRIGRTRVLVLYEEHFLVGSQAGVREGALRLVRLPRKRVDELDLLLLDDLRPHEHGQQGDDQAETAP